MIKMNALLNISKLHLEGLPGLSCIARKKLLQCQPATVVEALRIHGIGRKTTKKLLFLGLLTDPEGVQSRARTTEEMGMEEQRQKPGSMERIATQRDIN